MEFVWIALSIFIGVKINKLYHRMFDVVYIGFGGMVRDFFIIAGISAYISAGIIKIVTGLL